MDNQEKMGHLYTQAHVFYRIQDSFITETGWYVVFSKFEDLYLKNKNALFLLILKQTFESMSIHRQYLNKINCSTKPSFFCYLVYSFLPIFQDVLFIPICEEWRRKKDEKF